MNCFGNSRTNPNENVIQLVNDDYGTKLFDTFFAMQSNKLDWIALSNHCNLIGRVIIEHPDKPWKWDILTNRISIEDIVAYPHLPWNWKSLTRRVDVEVIVKHPNCPWDWYCVQNMRNFDPQIVMMFPDKNWNWKSLTRHPKLTTNVVRHCPNKDWDCEYLCTHHLPYDLENFTRRVLSTSCIIFICDCVNKNGYGRGKPYPTSPEQLLADIYIIYRITHFL